jgi:hypothetical protein
MKITNIEQKGDVFTVTYTPNALERFFGFKPYFSVFKNTGYSYKHYGNPTVYINRNGEQLDPTDKTTIAIDNWRRKF